MQNFINYLKEHKRLALIITVLFYIYVIRLYSIVLLGVSVMVYDLGLFFAKELSVIGYFMAVIGIGCTSGVLSYQIFKELYKRYDKNKFTPINVFLFNLGVLLISSLSVLMFMFHTDQIDTDYEVFSSILHFFIPNLPVLLPVAFRTLFQPDIFIMFILAYAFSVAYTYWKYKKSCCKICHNLKKEDFSPPLQFTSALIDKFKTGDNDFAELENLPIIERNQNHGRIKITSCPNCRRSIISVIWISKQQTSDGLKNVYDILCNEIEADYDWCQTLIEYYRTEYEKTLEVKSSI